MRLEFIAASELRDIAGFEGSYAVTSDGRIWSHPKVTGRRTHGGMWLTPGVGTTGYLLVVLCDHKKKRHTVKVHRAVALAWLPNPEEHPVLNHINGDAMDNRVANLEWCTQAHNVRHAHRTGLNPSRGLIEDEQPVLDALAAGHSVQHVAKTFGVSDGTVFSIKAGRYRPGRQPRQPKGESSHAH